MKKSLATLLVLVVLVFALAITAGAANYEGLADQLNELGLLRGSDAGYELDREPTRAEALVMLIRLLGLEEDALAAESENPFTDVPDWFAPYAAYAFENGLTSGTSATTFDPTSFCTAQMYTTFVLRALGYDDAAGDFTYAGAVSFGADVGIIDELLSSGTFLRDQMVAVSYLALSAEPKDAEFDTLLDKLAEAGAIDAAAAEGVQEKLDVLSEFLALGSELDGENSIAMTAAMALEMSLMGQKTAVDMDLELAMIVDGDDIQAAVEMVVGMDGTEMPIDCYIADGYIYINMLGEKLKVEYPISDLLAMSQQTASTPDMSYLFDSIEKSTEGGFTVYTAKFSAGFFDTVMDYVMSMLEGTPGMEGLAIPDISVSNYIIKLYTDADGALKKVGVSFDMAMMMEVEGSTMQITASCSAEIEITAIGGDVTVTLPGDLDDYLDASEMMVMPGMSV